MHQIVQFQSQKCKSSLVWEGGHSPPTPSPRSGASRPRLRFPSNIVDNLAPPGKNSCVRPWMPCVCRAAVLGLVYDFWEHHGHRTVPLRAPCVCLNICHKNYGCRRDALRRPCVIISKDVGQPQFFCLHKLKMRRTAAVANVTARVCSRRNTAAAVEFLLTVEM